MKIINQKKRKRWHNVFLILKEELEAIEPNLIIVATGYFWNHFGVKNYEKAEKEQERWINNKNYLLPINKVINTSKLSLPSGYVAIFPNPSLRLKNYKVNFYKKEYVPKLIEKIHKEIEDNYNNLPTKDLKYFYHHL